jgi:hypothetical protein
MSEEKRTEHRTYTYTARSAADPAQVVTFTLYDDRLAIGVGVPIEQIERAVSSRNGGEEGETQTEPEFWVKPVAVSLIERGAEPFNVEDVTAGLYDGQLRVTAWVRGGGLRLAPVRFTVNDVDNPDAAAAFVKELHRRSEGAEGASRLPGLFDYWAGWALTGLLTSALVALGLRLTRHGDGESA